MDIFSAAVMLFLIMDPMGNLPVFSSFLRHIEKKRRRVILIRELLIALAIMLLFLFTGESILNFLKLQRESISIAGSIILFLISLKMIFPTQEQEKQSAAGEEPFIVPLAILLLAGPSLLATLILFAHQDTSRMLDWSLAVILAWAVSAIILMFGEVFERLIGDRGLKAIERLMGMILLMLAVQMFLNGIQSYLLHIK